MRKVSKIWEKTKTRVADGDDRIVMAQFTKRAHTHSNEEQGDSKWFQA